MQFLLELEILYKRHIIAFKYARSTGRNIIVKYTFNNKLEAFDLNTVAQHSSCFAEGSDMCPVQ